MLWKFRVNPIIQLESDQNAFLLAAQHGHTFSLKDGNLKKEVLSYFVLFNEWGIL